MSESIEDQIRRLVEDKENLNQEILSMMRERTALTHRISILELRRQLAQAVTDARDLIQKNDELHASIRLKDEALNWKENALTVLDTALTQYTQKNQELESQVQSLTAQLDRYSRTIDSQSAVIDALRQKVSDPNEGPNCIDPIDPDPETDKP